MPTTYTGDPTSGLAPSPVPGPNTVPISTLPADGDADNAASVAQALKQPLNDIAWLKAPRSRAGVPGLSAIWAEALATFKNARLQIRSYVDHLGFWMGQVHSWEESWDRGITDTNVYLQAVGTGTIGTRAPTNTAPATPMYRTLKVSPPTLAATRTALVRTFATAIPTDNACATLKLSAILDAVGANRTTFVVGIVDSTGGLAGVPNWGAYFRKANGDTNWQCVVNGTVVDSGVAPVANSPNDFRIDLLGVNVSDDSTGRAIFYIDNVPVANITVVFSTLALTVDDWVQAFSGLTTTTGGAAVSLYVGPVKYRQTIFPNVGY